MRVALVALSMVLSSFCAYGCRARIPTDVFACTDDLDCPPEQRCDGAYCVLRLDGGPTDANVPVDALDEPDAPLRDAPLDAPDGVATVHLVHAAPGRGTVALERDGVPVTSLIPFGSTSSAVELPAGVALRTARGDGIAATESLDLVAGRHYALVYYLRGIADAIVAIEEPTTGATLFNAMDAQIVTPDGLDVAPRSQGPLLPGSRLEVAPRGGSAIASFDRSDWPTIGVVVVLTGRIDTGPRDVLGPHVVLGSPDFIAGPQQSLPMVWLARFQTSAAAMTVCDEGGALVIATSSDEVSGPYFDLPGRVGLTTSVNCTSGFQVVNVPTGPRSLLALLPSNLSSQAVSITEPVSPSTTPFRYVFSNVGMFGAATIAEIPFTSIAAGATDSADLTAPVPNATLSTPSLGSRPISSLPSGQLSWWLFGGGTITDRSFLAVSLNPGSTPALMRYSL